MKKSFYKKKCPKCGAELNKPFVFCPICNKTIKHNLCLLLGIIFLGLTILLFVANILTGIWEIRIEGDELILPIWCIALAFGITDIIFFLPCILPAIIKKAKQRRLKRKNNTRTVFSEANESAGKEVSFYQDEGTKDEAVKEIIESDSDEMSNEDSIKDEKATQPCFDDIVIDEIKYPEERKLNECLQAYLEYASHHDRSEEDWDLEIEMFEPSDIFLFLHDGLFIKYWMNASESEEIQIIKSESANEEAFLEEFIEDDLITVNFISPNNNFIHAAFLPFYVIFWYPFAKQMRIAKYTDITMACSGDKVAIQYKNALSELIFENKEEAEQFVKAYHQFLIGYQTPYVMELVNTLLNGTTVYETRDMQIEFNRAWGIWSEKDIRVLKEEIREIGEISKTLTENSVLMNVIRNFIRKNLQHKDVESYAIFRTRKYSVRYVTDQAVNFVTELHKSFLDLIEIADGLNRYYNDFSLNRLVNEEKKNFENNKYAYRIIVKIDDFIDALQVSGYIKDSKDTTVTALALLIYHASKENEEKRYSEIPERERSFSEIEVLNKYFYLNEEQILDKLMLYHLHDQLPKAIVYKYFQTFVSEKLPKIKKIKSLEKSEDEGGRISIEQIDLMSGIEFEAFISELFTKMGYETRLTKTTGDQGIDIVASKNGYVLGIQAKRYKSAVGNFAIQEAVAGKKYYQCNDVMVISSGYFTKEAKELAQVNGVRLWGREELIEKIEELFG